MGVGHLPKFPECPCNTPENSLDCGNILTYNFILFCIENSIETIRGKDSLGDERDAFDLVARIYDAAIDPSLWEPVLERLSDVMSGALISFHIQDTTGRVRLWRGVRADLDLTSLFLNGCGYTEPSLAPMAALLAMKPGTFVLREAVQNDADFRRSAIYNDIIRPQGLW